MATDLWFPNGSVITPDSVLIVNETFGNRRTAFDLTEDGTLVNRRVWAAFGPLPTERPIDKVLAQTTVAPDGACLDAEGAVRIADATGGRLLRVKEGGEITDEVRPGSPVYAVRLVVPTAGPSSPVPPRISTKRPERPRRKPALSLSA